MNSNHSYVFVTEWTGLWIGNTKSSYPEGMLYDGIKITNLLNLVGKNVVFVKIDKDSREVQAVHEGRIAKVELQDKKVYFEYDALQLIPSDKYLEFNKSGCYLNPNNYSPTREDNEYQKRRDTLLQLTKHEIFEDSVHKLMYQFHVDLRIIPRNDQAGKSDGFFKLSNLNVFYDATLRENFEISKDEQMYNFLCHLKRGYFDFRKERFTFDSESDKQVWIITKDCDKHIRTEDGIKIRAVSVTHLCNLLERFNEHFLNNEEQFKFLSNL